MKDELNEFSTIPIGNLEVAGEYYGSKVYTSQSLKSKFLQSLAESSKGGPVVKTVKDLIERKIVVPAYKTKSVFRSILKLNPINLQGIGGLTDYGKTKVFVFIETQANIFTFVSSNAIAIVTVHELVHLLSHLNKKYFISTFMEEFIKFYGYYFSKVFSCRIDEFNQKDLKDLITYIYSIEHLSQIVGTKLYKEYKQKVEKLTKDKTSMNEMMYNKYIDSYFTAVFTIFKAESNNAFHMVPQIVEYFAHIYRPLYWAYKNVFAADLFKERQLAFQELYAPSEVICTLTLVKSIPPKVYTALKKI
jgi:hypothetical protein